MSPVDLMVALAIGAGIFTLGLWVVRALATPVPDPAEEELTPVQVNYACSICGTRVTMTHASGADPKPPRHCREEMETVA